MEEGEQLLVGMWKAQRDLALSVLAGIEADAFEKKATPEDVARLKADIARCESLIAEAERNSQGS